MYKYYIYLIYIDTYLYRIYNNHSDDDGLDPLKRFADHTLTVSALWWHQKAFKCNSRPRFQLLRNLVQQEEDQK